jgi:CspA family cold shock protein
MTGTIKRLVTDRGFGFVKGEDGKEYFFHRSACDEGTHLYDMSEGDAVTFEEEPGSPKGPRARRLSLGATVENVSP